MPRFLCLALFLLFQAHAALAAPHRPGADSEVLERLPVRAADPRMQALNALLPRLRSRPDDVDTAVAVAHQYFELTAAEGDPRFVGYAQAALAPWWDQPAPPQRVRVMRAVLQQFNHRFAPALADLDAAVQADPGDAEAWAWLAAIHLVQADYPQARLACQRLAPHTSALIGIACVATVDAETGHAAAALQALRGALQAHAQAPVAERLWVLTRVGEIEERLGHAAEAEAGYRQALAQGQTDGYLLAAFADFLLDRQRPAEVLALLKDRSRSDVLLLRLALAAKAAGTPEAAGHAQDLASRFDAARLRGDTTHQKEEARFALGVQQQPAKALALAQANFAVQREPADARALLEAALAAHQPAAAEPALRWLADSGIESEVLHGLAQRLKGTR